MKKITLQLLMFLLTGAILFSAGLELKGKVYTDLYYVYDVGGNVPSGIRNGEFANLPGADIEDSDNRFGFQVRRIYLTMNKDFSKRVKGRLRLEMKHSSYKFTGSPVPFVKDLYLETPLFSGHSLKVGIQNPPTYDLIEKVWGYRSIEKTPLDLNKMRSSRDLGIMLKGSFAEKLFSYRIMIGNGNGGASEDADVNASKSAYLSLEFRPLKNFLIQLYQDADIVTTSDKEVWTSQIFIGYRGDLFNLGVHTAYQQNGNVFINILSIPAAIHLNDGLSMIFRADTRNQRESFSDISDTLILFGIDIKAGPVHLIPNIETVLYRYAGIAEGGITDTVYRLTLFYKY